MWLEMIISTLLLKQLFRFQYLVNFVNNKYELKHEEIQNVIPKCKYDYW